jgi:hypothetical protein
MRNVTKDRMDGASGMYGKKTKANLKEKEHLEHSGVMGRIILKYIFSVGRIELSQDREKWRAPVKVALNLRVHKSAENFLVR